MWASFGWGTPAASTLVIGAVVAILFHISVRWIGMIMAFGAGVLISAVAFDLVQEAEDKAPANWPIYLGIFAGCGVFFGADWLISRSGGGQRKDPTGAQRTAPPSPSCSDPCPTGSPSRW
jgi:ZIP family zinc transporter